MAGTVFEKTEVTARVIQIVLTRIRGDHSLVLTRGGAMHSPNEFIRDEMMSHVPLLAHGRVERALVVGAGRGLPSRVLEHRGVQSVVQVHGDSRAEAGVAGDPRLRHEGGSGAAFLAGTRERFDLILMDSPWFTEAMFRDARGCLRAGGVVVAKLGAPFLQPRAFSADMRNLAAVFSKVAAYLVPVPGTFGGPIAFGWGSSVLAPDAVVEDVVAARFADARIETRYYTPAVHRASFALPRFVDDLVEAATCPREAIAADALQRALSITGHHPVPGAVRC
jgi:spermidine synthase